MVLILFKWQVVSNDVLQKFLTYFAMYNKLGYFFWVIQRLYKGGSLVRFSAC